MKRGVNDKTDQKRAVKTSESSRGGTFESHSSEEGTAMLLWTIVRVALRSLLANKLRSILAMLGIIIGVGAVISTLALAAGARKQVLDQISAIGANLVVVRAGQSGLRGVRSGIKENMTLEDAQSLLDMVAGFRRMSPVIEGAGQFKYYNKNCRSTVLGVSNDYFPIRRLEIERGRAFTRREIERMGHVAILGPTTVANLFGRSDPIGETVKISGINFKVIGVTKEKGVQGRSNPDDQAVIPYTTAMKQVLGVGTVREINLEADAKADMDKIKESVTALLRQRHRLRETEVDDFELTTQAEIIETVASVSRTFTILLGSTAGISLLVGGIGIMNIMLVTVTERTREIGIRKAIGAKNRDILAQFLLESVVMSCLGGLIGIGLGIGLADLIQRLMQFSTLTQASSVLLAFSFSAGVGVFFGFYPARRAALLNPIEALRFE
ncbi:MAG: ABC transporter permease [Candidatus Sumerlaeota bacterium]|nr:ABC transporter permease [Candidatus Sumerlaeota bacterium]